MMFGLARFAEVGSCVCHGHVIQGSVQFDHCKKCRLRFLGPN